MLRSGGGGGGGRLEGREEEEKERLKLYEVEFARGKGGREEETIQSGWNGKRKEGGRRKAPAAAAAKGGGGGGRCVLNNGLGTNSLGSTRVPTVGFFLSLSTTPLSSSSRLA